MSLSRELPPLNRICCADLKFGSRLEIVINSMARWKKSRLASILLQGAVVCFNVFTNSFKMLR